jgi:hypothetical protein
VAWRLLASGGQALLRSGMSVGPGTRVSVCVRWPVNLQNQVNSGGQVRFQVASAGCGIAG